MIRLAPLNLPLERRLQTLAVLTWVLLVPVVVVLLIVTSLWPVFWIFVVPYVVWIFYDKAARTGGRRMPFMRRSKFWVYFRDYFPLKMVKDQELDPEKNYIFGVHPHGILTWGAFCNLSTESNNVSKVFPGIEVHLATLTQNFRIPFLREIFLGLGLISVDRKSLTHVLKSGQGMSVAIVIGGAAEALEARPHSNKLTLKKRKGFVKLALETGAHLVPCYSFGENDLYNQLSNPPGSLVRRVQTFLMQKAGFSMPLIYGRGIFQYNFGLLPRRIPIVTVVGPAIPVTEVENPTNEQIEILHELYIKSLKDLYSRYAEKYGDKNDNLQIVQ